MYKLIKYSTFFLVLIFFSCSTQKDYKAIGYVINELKSPINSNKMDTVSLVNYTYSIDEKILIGYKNQKKIILEGKIKPSSNFFQWVDKKYSWIIKDEEIDEMVNMLRNQRNYSKINKECKNFEKVVSLVDLPKYRDKHIEDLARQKSIKEDKFVYFFSNPVYNKKKDVFIIQYEVILLPFSRTTLIYKKEENKWLQIASLYENW